MYELDVAQRARDDLQGIYEYIASKLEAPKAALDFLDAVDACYVRIQENPYLYEQCRELRLQSEGYHRVVIGNYILVYRPLEETKVVEVHRCFYGPQNYMELI